MKLRLSFKDFDVSRYAWQTGKGRKARGLFIWDSWVSEGKICFHYEDSDLPEQLWGELTWMGSI